MSGLDGPPKTLNALKKKISNTSGGEPQAHKTARLMSMVVLSQMMPSGAIKGGTAMKIRMGVSTTRFSLDLGVAREQDLGDFIDELEANLRAGWNDFTGTVEAGTEANPKLIPHEYVMQPYKVKLRYKQSEWLSVSLEVGHDELGDTSDVEMRMAPEIAGLFIAVGLPAPMPVALLAPKHQIAQKLHAASSAGSERAHDLVDLQLLVSNESVNLAEVRVTCERLFPYRKRQGWPPTIVANQNWDTLYLEAAEGMDVLPSVIEAVNWANSLIERINSA